MVWSRRRGARFQRARRPQRPSTLKTCSKSGFTLVEMLVSVTLVLLMMVMFGEMFQLASGSVTRQRVLADNDQNARTFITVIRADLDKRSFRTLVPFFAGELSANPGTPFGPRKGYFYVSCNNLADGTDDLLQFTMLSSAVVRNPDESPYFGKAIQLYNVNPAGPPPLTASQKLVNFLTNPNQPDRDDGQVTTDQAGSSRAAEVAYWMRGGKLYRRSMLLRDPVPAAGIAADPVQAAQPTPAPTPANSSPLEYFLSNATTPPPPPTFYPYPYPPPYSLGSFWGDFDYSAHRMPQSLRFGLSYPPNAENARFNSVDYLSNDQSSLPHTPHPFVYSLGQTWNRFGHNNEISGSTVNLPVGPPYQFINNGQSREFGTNSTTGPANAIQFFGRFTQEETSNGTFNYPQNPPLAGTVNYYPMEGDTTNYPAMTLLDGEDANGNGILNAGEDTNGNGVLDGPDSVINQFAGGSRVGVDLLLSHVHEFRVEVWDDRVYKFVPVGQSVSPGPDGILGNADDILGDYNVTRRLNGTYGPLNPAGAAQFNVFDTWHPRFDRNFNESAVAPTGFGDAADQPPYRAMTYDPTGYSAPLPFNIAGTPFWTPSTTYALGDVVFEPYAEASTPPNATLDYYEKLAVNTQMMANGFVFSYRCVGVVGAGQSGAGYPAFSLSTGHEFVDNNQLKWRTEYNLRPLKAIRLTVRFEHPTSKQMKQVTLVHALRDTTSVP